MTSRLDGIVRSSSLRRRAFLKAGVAAGLGMGALPWRGARADVPASLTPRRYVFVIEGNGVDPVALLSQTARSTLDSSLSEPVGARRWWYNSYQHQTPLVIPNANLSDAPSLGALAGTATTTALDEKAMVVYGLSNKIAGGGHYTYSGALACARAIGANPSHMTIEALLASLPQVRQGTPFDAIRLGIRPNKYTERLDYQTFAFGPGQPAPQIVDPTTAFGNLFSSVGTPEQVAAFYRRSEFMDYGLLRTNKRLACFKGGLSERLKLEQYKSSLEALLERQAILESMSEVLSAAKPAGPDESPLYTSTDPRARLEAQFELATSALLSGLTNVIAIGIGTGGAFDMDYPAYNAILDGRKRHDTQHEAGTAGFLATIHSISADYITLTANLARTLDSIPENGGTMLDHTVIVYLGDNGEQHHSTSSEWPLLFLGGGALGFQTDGRTVVYPGVTTGGANHRQLSSAFVSLAHSAAEPITSFGGEGGTLIANGPLSELWTAT